MPVRNGAMPEAPEGGHVSQAGTPLIAGTPAPDRPGPPLVVAVAVERAPEAGEAAALAAGFVGSDGAVGRIPSDTTPLRTTPPGVAPA